MMGAGLNQKPKGQRNEIQKINYAGSFGESQRTIVEGSQDRDQRF
jgi:hypothetical protein